MAACLTSPVQAAHWEITYQSAGTNIGIDNSTQQPFIFPWSSISNSQGYLWTQGETSGTITPVLTWTLDSGDTILPPAPTQIIAQVDTSVVASIAMSSGMGTGMTVVASDSLDGAGQPTGTSSEAFCQVSGTHYLLVSNPKAQVTVMMQPISGDASSSGNGNGPYGYGFVSIVVTPFNPTLNLAGTTKDSSGKYNILNGQGCTASLSGLPPFATAAGNKTTYYWNITGTTFQTWSPTTPAIGNAPPNPNASYYVGGPGILYNPTAHWYWNDPDPTTGSIAATETVFYRATVRPPTGQGNPFTLTQSQPVNVEVPTWTAYGTGGYMQVNASVNGGSNYELWAGPTTSMKNNNQPGGMNWTATVHTPTVPAFGLGSLELVQIATPSSSYTNLIPPVQSHSNPLSGMTGLDLTYPYGDVYVESAQQYADNDSPDIHLVGLGLTGDVVAGSAAFQSAYKDYLLYKPPGSDSQWVPRATFGWSTNGSATIPTTNNWADYITQYGSDKAGTVSPNVTTPFTKGNTFPSWTQIDIPTRF